MYNSAISFEFEGFFGSPLLAVMSVDCVEDALWILGVKISCENHMSLIQVILFQ